MASYHFNRSYTDERPAMRQSSFLPGVGNVPSGPRRAPRPVAYRDFYIPSYSRTYASQGQDRDIRPKEEEVNLNLHALPNLEPGEVTESIRTTEVTETLEPVEAPEAVDGLQHLETPEAVEPQNAVKKEPSPEAEDLRPVDPNYLYSVQRLLAQHARSTRSDSTGSQRQDFDGGTRQRSNSRFWFQSRDRSRSPGRLSGSSNLSGSSRATSRHNSPMFVSDRRESISSTSIRGNDSLSVRRSRNTSSSPPSPSRIEEEQDPRCRCPIGYMCPVRHNDHLDCRPLVREYQSWGERRNQEAFDVHRAAGSSGQENLTTVADLLRIVPCVNNFMNGNTAACRAAVEDMRAWILDMEDVTITIGIQQLNTTQHVIPALQTLLDPNYERIRRLKHMPKYIEEELTVVLRKWARGDFCGDPKRGLTEILTHDVNGIRYHLRYEVDRTWPFFVSGLYFGAGQLVNGQIWESREELQRDGVHAPPQAGISGKCREGARSILLGAFDERNNLGYADIDMGEVIEYVGTALPDTHPSLGPTNVKDPHMSIPGAWDPRNPGRPSAATRAMFKSMETRKPVRVIRSFKMCAIVENKPRKGYRYDGLYRVVRATALKERRQIWSFRLHRLPEIMPHQGPLRGYNWNSQRPSSNGRRIGHFHE